MSKRPGPSSARSTALRRPPIEAALSRRSFVSAAGALAVGLLLPRSGWANSPAESSASTSASSGKALAASRTSPLIYVSPLKANGLESHCHGEVWFVADDEDLLVVTNPERWRAACLGKGLDRARIWVGDHGLWKKSGGAFRKAPSYVARGSIDADPAVHARALEAFGKKYADEWGKWGPRFQKGLASGERVLIRYSPSS